MSSALFKFHQCLRGHCSPGFHCRVQPYLHAVHGLSDLVQVVSRAKRLQADIRQLELLLPQLVLQLEDDFGLGLGALAQPATGITHREEEGVTFGVIPSTHT